MLVILRWLLFVLMGGLSGVAAGFQSAAIEEIPFKLNAQDNLIFEAVLDRADSLNLMFHTGASELTLTTAGVKKLTGIQFQGEKVVTTWGGTFTSRYSQNHHLQIQSFTRDRLVIWEVLHSGADSDGKFGFDFFPKQIVEIDFEQLRLRIHPQLPEIPAHFQQLELKTDKDMLMIEGTGLYGEKSLPQTFMIHSGYGGGILLDDEFVAKHELDRQIEITKTSQLRDSAGNVIEVKSGELSEFRLGQAKVTGVPIGFFAGNLGQQRQSVMGCKILKEFHWFFDLERQTVYVAPRVKK